MSRTVIDFESYAAERLSESAPGLAETWLLRSADAFRGLDGAPATTLMPGPAAELLRHAVGFIRDGDADGVLRNPAVTETLARLHVGSTPVQPETLLREPDVLAQVLDGACIGWLRGWPDGTPEPAAVVRVAGRLNRAPILFGELLLRGIPDEEADAAADRLRQFAHTLGHELRTPLNAAAVTAQLLEYMDGSLQSAEARRLVTLMRRSIARLDSILSDVTTATLSPTERASGPARRFGQVLGEVLAQVHDELVAAGVRLDLEEPIADLVVDAAGARLILVNLIRNAIRYSDPSRRVRWIRVISAREAATGAWWIHVSDNGIGIPAQHHGDVFRQAFQAQPSSGGSGLGLMIVHQEIARLGGQIGFTSEPGVGTTFRFTLPPAHGGSGSDQ